MPEEMTIGEPASSYEEAILEDEGNENVCWFALQLVHLYIAYTLFIEAQYLGLSLSPVRLE